MPDGFSAIQKLFVYKDMSFYYDIENSQQEKKESVDS